MTYYDSFDCKIQCEEGAQVSEAEQEEVFRLIAEEREAMQGFEAWLYSLEPSERAAVLEQMAFDAEQEKAKAYNWNKPDADEIRLGGIAI